MRLTQQPEWEVTGWVPKPPDDPNEFFYRLLLGVSLVCLGLALWLFS